MQAFLNSIVYRGMGGCNIQWQTDPILTQQRASSSQRFSHSLPAHSKRADIQHMSQSHTDWEESSETSPLLFRTWQTRTNTQKLFFSCSGLDELGRILRNYSSLVPDLTSWGESSDTVSLLSFWISQLGRILTNYSSLIIQDFTNWEEYLETVPLLLYYHSGFHKLERILRIIFSIIILIPCPTRTWYKT